MQNCNYENVKPSSTPLAIAVIPCIKQVNYVIGNSGKSILYEFMVVNGASESVRILAVIAEFATIENCRTEYVTQTLCGDKLKESFRPMGTFLNPSPFDPLLPTAASGAIFMNWSFPHHTIFGSKIINTLIVQVENKPETIQSITIDPLFIKDELLIIKPPLRGEKWLDFNGFDVTRPHRRSMFVINGNLTLSERYSSDFVLYGPKGLYDGDVGDNDSWYSYGQPIYAVANMKIVKVVDEFPDLPPLNDRPPFTLDNIAGNHVIGEIKFGYYACFCHLIPGSILCKVGDYVCVDQIIGKLGNSGNSSVAHLHFQICDKPDVIISQGLGYGIDRFIYHDHVDYISDENANVRITSSKCKCNNITETQNLISFC